MSHPFGLLESYFVGDFTCPCMVHSIQCTDVISTQDHSLGSWVIWTSVFWLIWTSVFWVIFGYLDLSVLGYLDLNVLGYF